MKLQKIKAIRETGSPLPSDPEAPVSQTSLQKRSQRLMSAQIQKTERNGSQNSNEGGLSFKNSTEASSKHASTDKERHESPRHPFVDSRLAGARNFVNLNDQRVDTEFHHSGDDLTELTLRRGKGFREPKETIPPRTIDESQEETIIHMLEEYQKQRLQEDPLGELEEALMDRTTASMNRRQKITQIQGTTVTMEEVTDIRVFALHNNFHSPSLTQPKKLLSPLRQRKKASLETRKSSQFLGETSSSRGSDNSNNSIKIKPPRRSDLVEAERSARLLPGNSRSHLVDGDQSPVETSVDACLRHANECKRGERLNREKKRRNLKSYQKSNEGARAAQSPSLLPTQEHHIQVDWQIGKKRQKLCMASSSEQAGPGRSEFRERDGVLSGKDSKHEKGNTPFFQFSNLYQNKTAISPENRGTWLDCQVNASMTSMNKFMKPLPKFNFLNNFSFKQETASSERDASPRTLKRQQNSGTSQQKIRTAVQGSKKQNQKPCSRHGHRASNAPFQSMTVKLFTMAQMNQIAQQLSGQPPVAQIRRGAAIMPFVSSKNPEQVSSQEKKNTSTSPAQNRNGDDRTSILKAQAELKKQLAQAVAGSPATALGLNAQTAKLPEQNLNVLQSSPILLGVNSQVTDIQRLLLIAQQEQALKQLQQSALAQQLQQANLQQLLLQQQLLNQQQQMELSKKLNQGPGDVQSLIPSLQMQSPLNQPLILQQLQEQAQAQMKQFQEASMQQQTQ